MPKSRAGKLSVGFIIGYVVIYVFGWVVRPTTNGPGVFPAGEDLYALASMGAVVAGIVSFITGLFAIVKRRERSALVYAAVLISLLPIGAFIYFLMFLPSAQ
jgi:hypothetical protein